MKLINLGREDEISVDTVRRVLEDQGLQINKEEEEEKAATFKKLIEEIV